MTKNTNQRFDLTGRVVIITGGAGLLGFEHAKAIAGAGGIPVITDVNENAAKEKATRIKEEYKIASAWWRMDVTDAESIRQMLQGILEQFGRVDVLINNAANNPKMESTGEVEWSRFENFQRKQWEADIAVGLTGSFLCSQIIGSEMAKRGGGVILNIASDLAVIAPDQRLYRQESVPDDKQPVKPVTYSVVKSGLIGLTRYLSTYWCKEGVRVNALLPGGVYNGQPESFVSRLVNNIPMGRMAERNEYQCAVVFMCSDASSYMNGSCVSIDGGRTAW